MSIKEEDLFLKARVLPNLQKFFAILQIGCERIELYLYCLVIHFYNFRMTRLIVSEKIFTTFPDVLIGVISAREIDNSAESQEVMENLHREEMRVRERLANQQLSEHPQIAPWREAYRKFGAKPKEYQSSVENLIRRVIKGYSLPHINMLVDLYNTISLRYVVPAGGEDLDQIEGDIELTFAGDNEPPVKLLGEPEARSPKPGEVIYKDAISAICRRWNWKEADRTKLSGATRNAILVVEALPPIHRAQLNEILNELASLVRAFCNGNINPTILDKQNSEVEV
jgi:DNA/RNA-binding domain of Phe-tRNA-synthetase-like protein